MPINQIISMIMISAGMVFMLIATIGFVRLPDMMSRIHATGILDTLAAPLVLGGVAVWIGPTTGAGKLIFAISFIYFTSPFVTHLFTRAALESGYKPNVVKNESFYTKKYSEDIFEDSESSKSDPPKKRVKK